MYFYNYNNNNIYISLSYNIFILYCNTFFKPMKGKVSISISVWRGLGASRETSFIRAISELKIT